MPKDMLSTLQVGQSMQIEQAPLQAPPAVGEETPSPNNETVTQPADKAVTEPGEAFNSGGKKARELGERSKKLASTLLESAKSSPEVAEQVKKLASENPELEKYIQKHFKKDYEVILKDRPAEEVEKEFTSTAEQEKVKVRAEMLLADLQEEKDSYTEDFAAQLKLTGNQLQELKDLATKLEGQTVGGKVLDHKEALVRAAFTIAPQKAQVGLSFPSGSPNEAHFVDQELKNTKYEELASQVTRLRGEKNTEKIVANLKKVDKGFKNGVYKLAS